MKKKYQICNERDLLSKLNHPNIVKLKHKFQDKSNIYFLCELANRGDLSGLLKQSPDNKLPLNCVKFVVASLIRALEYLHSNGIAH